MQSQAFDKHGKHDWQAAATCNRAAAGGLGPHGQTMLYIRMESGQQCSLDGGLDPSRVK